MALGASSMNGSSAQPPQQQQQEPPAYDQTALAVFQPVVITPALIGSAVKWISGAVVAVVGIMSAANGFERYMLPAKDSDLKLWVEVVKGVQQAQGEQKQSIDRLTLAVDNLSSEISIMRKAPRASAVKPSLR